MQITWHLLGYGFALVIEWPSRGSQAFTAVAADAQLCR
jgi:hypothetical protein